MPMLTQDGPLWTIDLGDDENRFSPEWLSTVEGFLDDLAASTEPAALVTVGGGKFYTNGLDLDWLGAHPDELGAYVGRVHALFERVLTLPVPTIAAVNGHAFGAGAMLAMAHDFRVMRTERGYFCFPEVDIHIPFTPGMNALILAKLTPQAAVASMTTGRRYAADDACAAGIVDAVAPVEELVQAAGDRVRDLAGKDRGTLATIKATMYAGVVAALREGR
ncbi:enoyl-CoA hydratase/isomerase family protein [Nocardioides hankookensis]|uniref:Enoyl-CoA hydratase-related protein n=1 Tax=Nocardioides hankookensis TaxID=443157 RepID=A0ABW1LN60_9ACTN